ncbi:hypothetical protein Ahia01_000864600 [Argonauta hians]
MDGPKTAVIFIVIFSIFPSSHAFLNDSLAQCGISVKTLMDKKYCDENVQKSLKCIAVRNKASGYETDMFLRTIFNLQKLAELVPKFCTYKLKKCDEVAKISDKLRCVYDYEKYNYLNTESCSTYKAMVTSKLSWNIQSYYCQETMPSRGLIPSYGPQLKCYKFLLPHMTNPLEYHIKFCKVFDYNNIKNCTLKQLDSVPENEFINSKSKFHENSLKYLENVKYFCEHLLKIPNDVIKSCPSKVNFTVCEAKALSQTNRVNASYRPGTYLECIYSSYALCDSRLGSIVKVIYDNKQDLSSSPSVRITSTVKYLLGVIVTGYILTMTS